jgi:MFS family permease
MSKRAIGALGYILRTSPVYVAVLLMRFSFAFTVVAIQYIVPVAVERGIISAAYPVAEMLTGLGFGMLSDRVGRKWIIVGALLAASVVSLSFTLTRSFVLYIIIHGLLGVCAAAIITTTLASLADVSNPETRGREMGFYDFCTIGGYGLGFVFSLVLINGRIANAFLPFYLGSLVALIGGVFSAVLLKDESGRLQPRVSLPSNLWGILSSRKSITLIATWFVLTILIGVGLTYTRELVAVILRSRTIGLTGASGVLAGQPTRVGLLLAVLLVFGVMLLAFSQTTLGSLSDK